MRPSKLLDRLSTINDGRSPMVLGISP
ncbi:LOW QUALITY PROTEIN: hypothetical protein PanWU01x14_106300 [Parasponia andersonii]|uniref:Uncharacterized protein n=1 Tax=Parasponia andersonii TaxID=3476 RepID=A0A2P5D179_PARAD|nr:LOW QUALITY PROTEIN: hypothetical protein PanWU01x14_106300 [Parasponia andersonii]